MKIKNFWVTTSLFAIVFLSCGGGNLGDAGMSCQDALLKYDKRMIGAKRPQCEEENPELWVAKQCAPSGWCFCVDSVTGISVEPIQAARFGENLNCGV